MSSGFLSNIASFFLHILFLLLTILEILNIKMVGTPPPTPTPTPFSHSYFEQESGIDKFYTRGGCRKAPVYRDPKGTKDLTLRIIIHTKQKQKMVFSWSVGLNILRKLGAAAQRPTRVQKIGKTDAQHVLLMEIKGTEYRPTKIPLKSVRPFEYAEVVLKEESDIDPNDQATVLEHLDKVVRNLIEKSSKTAVSKSEHKLPLVRVKVDYSGFMTINPQRFGQKYVNKVANPQDILIFSKAAKKRTPGEKIDDSERLRPEELNQQNIEALVAESNLKMEILPVNDLDIALHDFVNKDDKMAFYACLKYNLEETRNKLNDEAKSMKIAEEELELKVGECMQDRVKQRSLRSKEDGGITSGSQNFVDIRGKSTTSISSMNSFSDDEDNRQMLSSSKTAGRGKRGSSETSRGAASRRGRGGRSSNLKQMTLDATMTIRQSQRSASASASASVRSIAEEDAESLSSEDSDKTEAYDVPESPEQENLLGKGRKRAAPRGRGRGSTPAKRGKKTDISSIQSMLMAKDDDDDEDDIPNRLKKAQPRATRNYGAVRKRT